MENLISVVINAYNAEKYINKCIDNVVNQTYKNLEILIVNDGSTDNTLEICKSYKDDRIRIINQENMGLSMARNVGIDNAKGDYLYFVDADDFIDNDTIEYLYNLCIEYNTDMSTCVPIDIYNYDYKKNKIKEKVLIISGKDILNKILLSNDRAGCLWNKLIKKELLVNLRFEDRIINDVAFVYKFVLKLDRIAYSNQNKYYYYRRNDSIIGTQKPEYLIDLYKASLERYNYIKGLYPDLKENNIGMMTIITIVYFNGNEEVHEFIKKQDYFKLYKEIFTIKCDIGLKNKIKFILFRINPTFYKKVTKIYLKIFKRKK